MLYRIAMLILWVVCFWVMLGCIFGVVLDAPTWVAVTLTFLGAFGMGAHFSAQIVREETGYDKRRV